MLFSNFLAAYIQTRPWAEGGKLIEAGLLRPVFDGRVVMGVEATDALRACFCGMPPLERLYPLLVEFVTGCRFPELDDRRAFWKLRALGMSEEGIGA